MTFHDCIMSWLTVTLVSGQCPVVISLMRGFFFFFYLMNLKIMIRLCRYADVFIDCICHCSCIVVCLFQDMNYLQDVSNVYSELAASREPSLQRQYLFPKMLQLKWLCCCKESVMRRLIYKKGLVLFQFPRTTSCFGYLLELPHWGNSNKYPKHM